MQGSFINRVSERAKMPTPEVGMGVTFFYYTDREAGTVVEVSKDKKTIIVQEDNAKRTDNNGMSEMQDYEFTPNPEAHKQTFTLRKNGSWVKQGQGYKSGQKIGLGHRDKYHDFSF